MLLPHPDGPTSETKVWPSISKLMSVIAVTGSWPANAGGKIFLTFLATNLAIGPSRPAAYRLDNSCTKQATARLHYPDLAKSSAPVLRGGRGGKPPRFRSAVLVVLCAALWSGTISGRSGSYAHGAFGVDYEARIDLAALATSASGARAGRAADSPLDALLLWKDENVRYLTGLRAADHPRQVRPAQRLPAGRRPASLVLFCSGGEVDRVRTVMPWIEERRAVPIMEARGLMRGAVEETLAPVLERARPAPARVGLDEFAYAQVAGAARALPGVDARRRRRR